MIVTEYGKENQQVVILLHGGGLSWWNYRECAEYLQKDCHVVLPVINGHGENQKDFTGIEAFAEELIEFIDDRFGGQVALLGGASLGAQIALKVMAEREGICQSALIESALVEPMRLTNRLVEPLIVMSWGLIKQKWFSRLQFSSLRIKEELFADYYRDTCRMTKENLIAVLKANSACTVWPNLQRTEAKVYLFVGEKENPKMKKSARVLHELLEKSELTVVKKRAHGEFSLNCAKEYAQTVKRILQNRD